MTNTLYDESVAMEGILRHLVLDEIAKMPNMMRESENPFVYLNTVKQLIFTRQIALYINTKPASRIPVLLAHRQLDVLFAVEKRFHHCRMGPQEFVDHLFQEILPQNSFFLTIERGGRSMH